MKHHGYGHPRRPSIAIIPDIALATPDAPFPKYELRAAYADAIIRAGGLPWILPYTEDRSCIEASVERVSGLLLTGGAFDVPPDFYGEEPKEGLGALKPLRTHFEMAILRLILQRRLPVLGICGGMQLINVAYGGSLYQDLAHELPSAKGHEQKHDRSQPQHPVDVKERSILGAAVGGGGQLMVNSTHHQAVNRIGPGLTVSATAPDGVIEAIEAAPDVFVVGVQWHPELLIDTVPPNLALFRAFVSRARDKRP